MSPETLAEMDRRIRERIERGQKAMQSMLDICARRQRENFAVYAALNRKMNEEIGYVMPPFTPGLQLELKSKYAGRVLAMDGSDAVVERKYGVHCNLLEYR